MMTLANQSSCACGGRGGVDGLMCCAMSRFKMPNIKGKVQRQLASEPVVDHYKGEECLLTDAYMFRDVDCQTGSVSA